MDEMYLAFDLGASSGRAMLGHVGRDRQVQLEQVHRFVNTPVANEQGVFWDIERLFGEMKRAMGIIAQRGILPRAIGVDTWGVDFALLGHDGQLLAQPRCYRDPRNSGISRRLAELIGPERLLERTGSMFQDHASLCQYYAAKLHSPELLRRAGRLLFIPDLLRYWMCGQIEGSGDAVEGIGADITFASTSQMYDVLNRAWATDILEELELPTAVLPHVTVGPRVAGHLAAGLCGEVGLGPIPVVCGAGHDTGAAFGICRGRGLPPAEDLVVISSGTWAILGIFVDRHLPPGTLEPSSFGYEANPDGSLRIVRNLSGAWLIERCRDGWQAAGQDASYTALIAAARAAASSARAKAVIDPQWEGFMHPRDMCASIAQYCRQSGQAAPETLGEFAQVIFVSLADSYAQAISELRAKTGKPLRHLYVVGGMSQNAYLNEMTAQQAGVKVLVGPAEATTLGNIAVQMQAIGAA